MQIRLTRRGVIAGAASAVLTSVLGPLAAAAQSDGGQPESKPLWLGNGMPQEGPDTPKIACGMGFGKGRFYQGNVEQQCRELVQLGVTHGLGGGPSIPWNAAQIGGLVEDCKASGVTLGNLMIDGFPKIIYGRPGRDEEIEMIRASIEAAGKAGLPVIEYNFYAHRAIEGYYEMTGRGGAGLTGSDYSRMKGLPPLPDEGVHTLEEMWANITYFLKAIIPVAEKNNVRMALHPNDPPYPLSRGSQQIMATLDGWKHLIGIVDSPSNGITFDCGVTCEIGEDPVAVCRYFGSRDRINHVHFRSPHVFKPSEKYVEGFIDEGDVNLFAVMRELVRQKYPRELYPEHPRLLDYDRARGNVPGYPGGGGYTGDVYDIAYTKALLQAALEVERG